MSRARKPDPGALADKLLGNVALLRGSEALMPTARRDVVRGIIEDIEDVIADLRRAAR
jgi:hypothetical protein